MVRELASHVCELDGNHEFISHVCEPHKPVREPGLSLRTGLFSSRTAEFANRSEHICAPSDHVERQLSTEFTSQRRAVSDLPWLYD